MTLANLLAITDSPHLSALIWVLALLVTLYLGRGTFHRAVGAAGRMVYRATRLLAAAFEAFSQKLAQRNRKALFAAGRLHLARLLAQEFDRISAAVPKDLQGYPRIHRQLSEIISGLEGDRAQSADVPPSLPEWIPVIRSIADIGPGCDGMVHSMLNEIQRSLEAQHVQASETYRQSTARRHAILNKMMPLWRRVDRRLGQVDGIIRKLSAQAQTIDRHMSEYAAIRSQEQGAEDMLRAGALKQFFMATLMLAIAAGAAWLNYQIISAAVAAIQSVAGAGAGGLTGAQAAALALVLTQIGLGVFLMEMLRVTHLFAILGSMQEVLRRRFVVLSAALLAIMAGLGCLLVYFAAAASGGAQEEISRIPPMVLGGILPVVLASVAIPLETFATTVRFPAGFLATGVLTLLVIVLRLIGNLAGSSAKLLAGCYDIIIFPAVWIEDAIASTRRRSVAMRGSEPAGTASVIEKPVSKSAEA